METADSKARPGSPAWNSLLSRALMALDEEGAAEYRRVKESMAKKLERNMRERGFVVPPYDFYMVQEVLVEYDRCGMFAEALKLCGGRESECIEARAFDADIRLAWDFVKARLKERMAVRAADIALYAQEGLQKKVTDAKCGLDPKALKLALENVAPELYGGKGGGGGSDEGEDSRKKPPAPGGIVINIIGDAAAKLAEPKSGGRAGGVYIDV